MTLIQLKNLSCRFPNGRYGLRDINLEIFESEFLVVAGANGSGKTSFCRALNGLLSASSGEILLEGTSIQKNLLHARQKIGVVFQNADHQIVGETVEADVAFGPENLKLKPEEIQNRVHTALAAVGLQSFKDHHPHALSGGEKRRLAIAGVLAMIPKVLVLDEPFSNLDYSGVRQVLNQLVSLHQSGHTIIVVTHDLEKVIAHANRLVILNAGRIAEVGNPADIYKIVESYGVREPCHSKLGYEVRSWLN